MPSPFKQRSQSQHSTCPGLTCTARCPYRPLTSRRLVRASGLGASYPGKSGSWRASRPCDIGRFSRGFGILKASASGALNAPAWFTVQLTPRIPVGAPPASRRGFLVCRLVGHWTPTRDICHRGGMAKRRPQTMQIVRAAPSFSRAPAPIIRIATPRAAAPKKAKRRHHRKSARSAGLTPGHMAATAFGGFALGFIDKNFPDAAHATSNWPSWDNFACGLLARQVRRGRPRRHRAGHQSRRRGRCWLRNGQHRQSDRGSHGGSAASQRHRQQHLSGGGRSFGAGGPRSTKVS